MWWNSRLFRYYSIHFSYRSWFHTELFKLSCSCVSQVCNQLILLFLFLDASKDHLSAGNIFFWICQVDVKSVLLPDNACDTKFSFKTSFSTLSLTIFRRRFFSQGRRRKEKRRKTFKSLEVRDASSSHLKAVRDISLVSLIKPQFEEWLSNWRNYEYPWISFVFFYLY